MKKIDKAKLDAALKVAEEARDLHLRAYKRYKDAYQTVAELACPYEPGTDILYIRPKSKAEKRGRIERVMAPVPPDGSLYVIEVRSYNRDGKAALMVEYIHGRDVVKEY